MERCQVQLEEMKTLTSESMLCCRDLISEMVGESYLPDHFTEVHRTTRLLSKSKVQPTDVILTSFVPFCCAGLLIPLKSKLSEN